MRRRRRGASYHGHKKKRAGIHDAEEEPVVVKVVLLRKRLPAQVGDCVEGFGRYDERGHDEEGATLPVEPLAREYRRHPEQHVEGQQRLDPPLAPVHGGGKRFDVLAEALGSAAALACHLVDCKRWHDDRKVMVD